VVTVDGVVKNSHRIAPLAAGTVLFIVGLVTVNVSFVALASGMLGEPAMAGVVKSNGTD
jgi:hypothetical protein